MKSLHFNNHISSKQTKESFGKEIFEAIFRESDGQIIITVDDGDGDVWKYTLTIDVERLKTVTQIKEN
jgi:hypothetical protein